ncbi:Pr6Pr family membrane protein [Kitasatospora sp. NBC_01302]|uniref:Pr6Pr family membrane protein n=1 Tax=Kitasatospora sp. NBC_01302 TaxID=2903575 RepID=UPI002E11B35D|nr:Pr6Pr family membrane protein [Kitasatospora sp. NBC_01302]
MHIWTRPTLWWRLAIVLSSGFGLILGTSSLVYFTVQSNVLVFGYFAGAVYWMTKRGTADAPAPRLRGAATLYIMITGLVAHILLNHGADPLPGLTSGPDRLQNWSSFLLHYTTPVLVLLDWLCARPRNASRWRDLPLWLSFPLTYAGLTMARAALFPDFPNKYPYFFFDPSGHGYGYVWGQIAQLTVEFIVLAALVVGLDRLGTAVRARLRPTTSTSAAAAGQAEAQAVPAGERIR